MNLKQEADDIAIMHHQLQEALSMHSPAVLPFARQLQHYLDQLNEKLNKIIKESE